MHQQVLTIATFRLQLCALACLLTFVGEAPALARPRHHTRHHAKAPAHADGVCGTRQAVAHFRDNTASFAARNRIAEATFCALNGIARGSALVHKKRYVTARGNVGERLVGGQTMGPSTPDYVVVNPSRAWGQPFVVGLLRAAAHRVRQKFPGGQRIVFEDLSIEHGGCLSPHREHRSGLEVDAGLYHKGLGHLTHLRVASAANFDAQREWIFLQALLETGRVDRILLDPRIQGWLYREAQRQKVADDKLAQWFHVGRKHARAVFTDAAGHDNHTHIRFKCAPGQCAQPVELVAEGPAAYDEAPGIARPRAVWDWRAPLCLAPED